MLIDVSFVRFSRAGQKVFGGKSTKTLVKGFNEKTIKLIQA